MIRQKIDYRLHTSLAASSKLSTGKILSPLEAIRAFASSTLVPWEQKKLIKINNKIELQKIHFSSKDCAIKNQEVRFWLWWNNPSK